MSKIPSYIKIPPRESYITETIREYGKSFDVIKAYKDRPAHIEEIVEYCGEGFKIVRITSEEKKSYIINHVKWRAYKAPIDIVLITGKIWHTRSIYQYYLDGTREFVATKLVSIDIPKNIIEKIKEIMIKNNICTELLNY